MSAEDLAEDFGRLRVGKGRLARRLRAEEERQVTAAFKGSPDETVASKFNINISRGDLRLLMPGEWLNDEIINFYMSLLQEYCTQRYERWVAASVSSTSTPTTTTSSQEEEEGSPSSQSAEQISAARGEATEEDKEEGIDDEENAKDPPARPPRCHFFNTFFYPLLCKGGYQRVARWTRRVDLMSMDLIVFPVHKSVHWTLATASPRERTLAYYDSMQMKDAHCVKQLRAYLEQEEKKGQPPNADQQAPEWRLSGPDPKAVPQQMNGSDCGVFTCMFARSLALGKSVSDIHQRDMSYYRKLMALEILNASIIDR